MAEGKAWKLIALNSLSKLEKGILPREDASIWSLWSKHITKTFGLDTVSLTGSEKNK